MAVPTDNSLANLSTTAGSNSPAGGESISTTDDYLRRLFAMQRASVTAGASVAAASSIALPDTGLMVQVTGSTTTINTLTNGYTGRLAVLVCDNPQILKHSTSLICPLGLDATVSAGDMALIECTGSNIWTLRAVLGSTQPRQTFSATASVPSFTPSPTVPYTPAFNSVVGAWTIDVGGSVVVPVTATYEIEFFMRPAVITGATDGGGFISLGLYWNGVNTGHDDIRAIADNVNIGATPYCHRLAMPMTAGGTLRVGILANATTVGSAILTMNARIV